MKIVFVNHVQKACGIYQIGRRIADFLVQSRRYNIVYREVTNAREMGEMLNAEGARGVIYNFYPGTMPFLDSGVTKVIGAPGIKQFGIIHDPMELKFIRAIETMFDAWIVHDETNPIINDRKFMTCRPIPRTQPAPPPKRLTFGSHGFGVGPWKDFDGIVEAINNEFDEALIRLNIGVAQFGDTSGDTARHWNERCRRKISKPGIELKITHEFFPTEQELIGFLQGNTVNLYFHRDVPQIAGPAGSADLAVASRRALIVNDNYMYRHIHTELGCYGAENRLVDLYRNEAQVQRLYEQWSPGKIVADYERMFDAVFTGALQPLGVGAV